MAKTSKADDMVRESKRLHELQQQRQSMQDFVASLEEGNPYADDVAAHIIKTRQGRIAAELAEMKQRQSVSKYGFKKNYSEKITDEREQDTELGEWVLM